MAPRPDHAAAPLIDEIAGHFDTGGAFVSGEPIPSGHINDTYLLKFASGAGEQDYILQRINHNVFKKPEQVMENIERVTSHARLKVLETGGYPNRQALKLISTRAGGTFYRTGEGEYWRMYRRIAGARTYEVSENPAHLYHAAKAFGSFIHQMDSLPGARLHETIPGFHHTPSRFTAFAEAAASGDPQRVRECRSEIDFLLAREADAHKVVDLLEGGQIPERVTHNDTKLNNVMIDDQTGEGLCVIDLDTVMPGSVLYDFGDLIRMGAATAAEDEHDGRLNQPGPSQV